MSRCPPQDDLSKFLEERLSDPDRQAVIVHVEGCLTCQTMLERLTASVLGAETPTPDVLNRQFLDRLPGDPATEDATPRPAGNASLSGSALSRFVAALAGRAPAQKVEAGLSVRPAVAGYEILEELGRGGMGVVYKARQVQLKRLVALKMILVGAHAGREQRARFRAEAEAVARLQHPHIVQIHEIGEQDGLPYFSLEFVEGGSLARHLDGKPLPDREAARLVEIVAGAMHYAHQRGIIHRDLKPGNILLAPNVNPKSEIRNPKQIPITQEQNPKRENIPVSDLGVSDLGIVSDFGFRISDFSPKITDFGLAKQLVAGPSAEGATSGPRTETGAVVGTPSYMAPEQALGKGRAVGPAADIHALGAILYALLTGRPPFQGVTLLDTLEQVCTQEPVPPSRLQPKVPRDLETICLKCLAKEPEKRYASAEELAEDLRRFQAGEPIVARPVRAWERGFKWARRRPAVAGLLVLVFLVTALGFGLVTWKWQEAEANAEAEAVARSLAEKQRQEAVQQRKRAENQKKQADAARRQAEENRKTALGAVDVFYKIADVYYQALERSPQLKAAGMEELRKNLLTIAVLFSDPGLAMRYSGSRLPADRAVTHLRLLRQTAPLLSEAEGIQLYQQTLKKIERMARAQPAARVFQGLLAQVHSGLGDLFKDHGRWQRAEKEYQAALVLLERRAALEPAVQQTQYDLSLACNNLAYFYITRRRFDRTEPLCSKAKTILEKLLRSHPKNATYRYDLAVSINNRGWAYQHTGRLDRAEKAYHEAIALRADLVHDAPERPDYQSNLAFMQNNLAGLYYARRRLDQAEKIWQKVLAIRQQLAKAHPEIGAYQVDLAVVHQKLGTLYQAADRLDQAEKAWRTVVALRGRLVHKDAAAADHALELARAWTALATCLANNGKPREALDLYGRAIPALEKLSKYKQPPAETRALLSQAFWGRAQVLCQLGWEVEALADIEKAFCLDPG